MRIQLDTIGTHTSTGESSISHALGTDISGKLDKIGDLRRVVAITGIAGGSVMKIQYSLDESNWFDLITSISADAAYIIEDPVPFIRSNCTTFGTGTVTVKASKILLED